MTWVKKIKNKNKNKIKLRNQREKRWTDADNNEEKSNVQKKCESPTIWHKITFSWT